MQIDISNSDQQRLATHAHEAGYSNVEIFVTEHVLALAQQPSTAELPKLSPQELEASLAMIDQSIAEIEAGQGLSLEEARQRSLINFQQLIQDEDV